MSKLVLLPHCTAEFFNQMLPGHLPGLFGMTVTKVQAGRFVMQLTIQPQFCAPNGFLHAGTVVSLADSSCGLGCAAHLPQGATGFTTIELKSNHLGTATEGTLVANAIAVHGGRTTQVWDAVVTHVETDRTLALFRCTQMILWPKGA